MLKAPPLLLPGARICYSCDCVCTPALRRPAAWLLPRHHEQTSASAWSRVGAAYSPDRKTEDGGTNFALMDPTTRGRLWSCCSHCCGPHGVGHTTGPDREATSSIAAAAWGRHHTELPIAAVLIMAQLAGLSLCNPPASQTLPRCGQNGASCPPLCPPMPVEQHHCGSKRHRSNGRLLAATKEALTYKQAGVDISAGAELVRRIQKLNPAVGGFSGLFPFGAPHPALRGSVWSSSTAVTILAF